MNTDAAYEFLESLQKGFFPEGKDTRELLFENILHADYENLVKTVPAYADAITGGKTDLSPLEMKTCIESYIQEQKQFIYAVPTKYENAYYRQVMDDLSREVEEATARLYGPIDGKVMLGSLPSGSIDAQTMVNPADNKLMILFDSGVFSFADRLSNIIAQCLVTESPEAGENYTWMGENYPEKIKETHALSSQFEDLLEACVFAGTPGAAPGRERSLKEAFLMGLYNKELDKNNWHHSLPEAIYVENTPVVGPATKRIAGTLRWVMEIFIIAHEYAHIAAGHLDSRESYPHFILNSDRSYDVLKRPWLDEHQADYMAFNIVSDIALKKGINLSLVIWGIEAFFSLIETIDKGICFFTQLEYKNFYPYYISHPLPQLRIGYIHYKLDASRKEGDPFHPALDQWLVTDIVDSLWDKFMMHAGLYGLVAERKVSPRWANKLKGTHHVKRGTVGFSEFIMDDWLAEREKTV